MPVLKTIGQIIAAAKAKRPWYDEFWSHAKITKQNTDDIGNLSVGAAPGFGAAYDTRFFVVEDSMASNAYVATLSPAATGESLPTGYSIIFLPSTGNTGASTLNVGSTDGAVDIKKYSSGSKVALVSGDLQAGRPFRLTFDGTDWVASVELSLLDEDDMTSDSDTQAPTQQSVKAYVNAVYSPVAVARAAGLLIEPNASNPTYQLDISADVAVLVNASGTPVWHANISETVDITASGAGGLDTGSEANSTWYYLWLVSNGSTIKAILSTSATAPTMPSGYTYKLYVGAVYNDSGGDLAAFRQTGQFVTTDVPSVMVSGGTATSFTLTGAAQAPGHVRTLQLAFKISGGVTVSGKTSIDGSATLYHFQDTASGDSGKDERGHAALHPCTTAQKVYYLIENTSTSMNVDCLGWIDHKVAA